MPRQHAGEERQRPLFQCLGKQRVIGVGKGLAGDRPGLVPWHVVLVHQQAHQLGDADGRMGVVELDGEFLVEPPHRHAVGRQQAQHVPQRARHEEVLLLEAQFLALLRFVIGVKHLGQVLRGHLLAHRAQVVAAVEGGKSNASVASARHRRNVFTVLTR